MTIDRMKFLITLFKCETVSDLAMANRRFKEQF